MLLVGLITCCFQVRCATNNSRGLSPIAGDISRQTGQTRRTIDSRLSRESRLVAGVDSIETALARELSATRTVRAASTPAAAAGNSARPSGRLRSIVCSERAVLGAEAPTAVDSAAVQFVDDDGLRMAGSTPETRRTPLVGVARCDPVSVRPSGVPAADDERRPVAAGGSIRQRRGRRRPGDDPGNDRADDGRHADQRGRKRLRLFRTSERQSGE